MTTGFLVYIRQIIMGTPFEEWIKVINPKTLNELKRTEDFKFCKQNIYKHFGVSQKMLEKIVNYFDYELKPLTKSKKLTTKEWVDKATVKHNGFYDYSLSAYINSNTKVKIICPLHGEFSQAPNSHSDRGDRCPKCGLDSRAKINRTTKEDFISKSNEAHNFKFDYSLVHDFKRLDEHLTIICPVHGEFKQNGHSHMRGSDCEKCSYEKTGVDYSISKNDMLKRFEELGNDLIYDLSEYKNTNSKIKYTCPLHGMLEQNAQKHLRGKKCWKCAKMIPWNKSNTIEFIEKAKLVHGDYYDYSLVEYNKNSEKVEIICKYHGSFMQKPNTHIDSLAGCPVCSIITSNIKDYMVTIEDTKYISCSLYIMELTNNTEIFYKIGISRYIKKRIKGIHYDSNKSYKAKIIYNLNTSLFEAATVEQELHKKYKMFKYKPLMEFKGHTECFTIELPVEEIISYLEQL